LLVAAYARVSCDQQAKKGTIEQGYRINKR
jgi:hypothetical protein